MHKLLYITAASLIFTISGCSVDNSTVSYNQAQLNISTNTPIDAYKSQMLSYMNSLRAGGAKCAPPAPALNWNNNLEKAAIAHTRDMGVNNLLTHSGSGTSYDLAKPMQGASSTFIDRINYFGYPTQPYMLVGENITYTLFKNTKTTDIMTNFKYAMNTIIHDKTHCEIFMNPRFKNIGVAMYKTKDRYYFAMELAENRK